MNPNEATSFNSPETGFFKKLINGDFGLAKTYWMYGVLVGFLIRLLSNLIESAPTLAIMLLIHGLYQIAVLIGTWKASNKYSGKKVWAILAKIAVVLGAIMLLINAIIIFSLIN